MVFSETESQSFPFKMGHTKVGREPIKNNNASPVVVVVPKDPGDDVLIGIKIARHCALTVNPLASMMDNVLRMLLIPGLDAGKSNVRGNSLSFLSCLLFSLLVCGITNSMPPCFF